MGVVVVVQWSQTWAKDRLVKESGLLQSGEE